MSIGIFGNLEVMLVLSTLFNPVGLSIIGFTIAILMIVEYVVLWLLTEELTTREQVITIINLIISLAYSIANSPLIIPPLYNIINNAYESNKGFYSLLYMAIFIALVILGIIPVLMYLRKYHNFNNLSKRYQEISLKITSVQQAYQEINSKLNTSQNEIKEVIDNINKATELYNTALRNPDLIITSLDNKPEMPDVVRPNINYVVVGLGGVGTALLRGFIDYLLSQGSIRENTDNPFLFVAFDTNQANISDLRNAYKGTVVENLLYTFDNFELLSANNIVNHNPWLAGFSLSYIQGAGNRRAVGFAMYNTVKDALMQDIAMRLTALINRTMTPRVLLIVLTSLGGGTGSGSFIHFTRDLLEKLRETTRVNDPYVLGFGVLPRSEEGAIFHINAMAAMKEMQFILSNGGARADEENNVTNPFLAFFLISRDRPEKDVDENIRIGLARFLSDIGTSGVREARPNNINIQPGGAGYTDTFDLDDIRTNVNLAPNSFLTFSRYDIYFPASRVSWYKNIGIRISNEINDRYTRLTRLLAEIRDDISKYKANTSNLENEINTLIEDLNSLITKVYRKWSSITSNMHKDLLLWRASIEEGGSYGPSNLETPYNRLMSSTEEGPNKNTIERRINEFNSTVKSEEVFLKNPPASSIQYVFGVPNLENFNYPLERTFLYEVLSQRRDEFSRALSHLRSPLGEIGLTMLNIDYTRINLPLNVTTDAKNFISEHNPSLIRNVRGQDDRGQDVVSSPPLVTALMVTTSSDENILVNEFPNDRAIRDGLQSKAINPTFKKGYIQYKRFDISTYHIINGIYVWKISSKEQPILRDLTYLERSYKEMKDNRLEEMIFHHTLFYDDLEAFENITNIGIGNTIQSEAVRKIADFWSNFDPTLYYIDIWGIIDLSYVYSGIKSINNDLRNIMLELSNAIRSLENGSTNIDLPKIRSAIDRVSNVKLPSAEIFNNIREKNETVNNQNVNRAIEDINKLTFDTLQLLEDIRQKYAKDYITKLNELKKKTTDYYLSNIAQNLINYVDRLSRSCDDLFNVLNNFREETQGMRIRG
ncbi:hypothetical protein DJ528_04875 [Sulfolobus sp. B5]|nr:hypothetical protein DJ528_04875 [Sulfolobus sp. B5]